MCFSRTVSNYGITGEFVRSVTCVMKFDIFFKNNRDIGNSTPNFVGRNEGETINGQLKTKDMLKWQGTFFLFNRKLPFFSNLT